MGSSTRLGSSLGSSRASKASSCLSTLAEVGVFIAFQSAASSSNVISLLNSIFLCLGTYIL